MQWGALLTPGSRQSRRVRDADPQSRGNRTRPGSGPGSGPKPKPGPGPLTTSAALDFFFWSCGLSAMIC